MIINGDTKHSIFTDLDLDESFRVEKPKKPQKGKMIPPRRKRPPPKKVGKSPGKVRTPNDSPL